MSETSIYVLLATFDDPDPSHPNEIWAFRSQVEAENFLRGWSEDFLGGYSHDCDDLPPDAELVAAFRDMGARLFLYRCHVGLVSGEEIKMFEHASKAA